MSNGSGQGRGRGSVGSVTRRRRGRRHWRLAGRGTTGRCRGCRSRDRSFAVQPSSLSLVTSSTLRGVPSGFEVSNRSVASGYTMSRTISARSRIEVSTPVPTLMCSSSL